MGPRSLGGISLKLNQHVAKTHKPRNRCSGRQPESIRNIEPSGMRCQYYSDKSWDALAIDCVCDRRKGTPIHIQ